MKKPNITEGEWKVGEYKSTTVISIDRDIVAENLRKENAKAISAVPQMIDALITVYPLLEDYIDFTNRDEFFSEKSTEFLESKKVEIQNALKKAGVEL